MTNMRLFFQHLVFKIVFNVLFDDVTLIITIILSTLTVGILNSFVQEKHAPNLNLMLASGWEVY